MYAVDTAHQTLEWSLRNDPRVVVMERTNAMRLTLEETVRLVTVDVGWTRQHLVLPRAANLLDQDGVILSLIKPHYEAGRDLLRGGVLPDEAVGPTVEAVINRLQRLGLKVEATAASPLRGDAGNREVFALIRPA